ncbi:MAG: Fic family protein [Planctomycetota bacterium]|nr:Fic family protein [Planctomycetota bacterium]
MQVEDFQRDKPGELVRNLEGLLAFVPHPLPPAMVWTDQLVSAQSEADRALARLGAVGDLGGISPHLLIRPFVRREAVLSSQIEGTKATLSDLLLFENAESDERTTDVREVLNYVRAMELGLESLKNRPLGCAIIRDLHQRLMSGARGSEQMPGAFRTHPVFIGRSQRIEEARFVPPPPLEVERLMRGLEVFIQTPGNIPPLVRAALAHYQFEAIHPFHDGNGRVGRLLITLMLCSEGLLSQPLLYLSAFFERNRQEYYDRLLEVSRRGAWNEWIEFFLRGTAHEAIDGVERIQLLLQLRQRYGKQMQKAKAPASAMRLIDELFRSPVITIKKAGRVLGLTPAATKNQIDRLVKAKILEEMTGGKRNMVFFARGILELVNRDKL